MPASPPPCWRPGRAGTSTTPTPSSQSTSAAAVEAEEGVVLVSENGRGPYGQRITAGRHVLGADEPAPVGHDTGPSPYDLLLAGLGACTSMTLRMYAARKGWPLEHVDVSLRHSRIHAEDCADCATRSGQLDRIERVIRLTGHLDADSAGGCSRSRPMPRAPDLALRGRGAHDHDAGRPAPRGGRRPDCHDSRRAGMSSLPIGEYALLSDRHSAALVSSGGSVDWLCMPRFDSPSVFAAILDDEAGHWSIRPDSRLPCGTRVRRRQHGAAHDVPHRRGDPRVARRSGPRGHARPPCASASTPPTCCARAVTCTRGRVGVDDVVPGRVRSTAWSHRSRPLVDGGSSPAGGADRLTLSSTVASRWRADEASARFELGSGERACFALRALGTRRSRQPHDAHRTRDFRRRR